MENGITGACPVKFFQRKTSVADLSGVCQGKQNIFLKKFRWTGESYNFMGVPLFSCRGEACQSEDWSFSGLSWQRHLHLVSDAFCR